MASDVWKVDDVLEHWDQIQMKSWVTVDGSQKQYQSGTWQDILPINFWIKRLEELNALESGVVVFTGTLATIGGKLEYGEKFEYEAFDPVLNRKLSSFYDMSLLMPALE